VRPAKTADRRRKIRGFGDWKVQFPIPSRMERAQRRAKVASGLIFGVVEKHRHDPVQFSDLPLVKVVLGDGDLGFADDGPAPACQAHVRFGGVGALRDQLRCGLAGDGEMQFVLHRLEKDLRIRVIRLVIRRQCQDFAHAQVHPALAGADVADAFEEFVEVVGDSRPGLVLQALVIEDETLDEVLLELGRGPLAELDATRRTDPVADSQDGVQVVMSKGALYLPGAFPANL
jgi:hypothetical protein